MSSELIKILKLVFIPFICVVLLTPYIGKIAVSINAVDVPREKHIHKRTIPKLGGIAIFLGFLLGYMLFGTPSSQMNSILIGSFIIILTGIVDDIAELTPKFKFCGQVLAALVLVFFGKLLISEISAFGIVIDFGIFAYPLTLFFIVACVNCMNLIDGLDGLSGGISSIYFLTIGIVATMQQKFGLEFLITFVMLGSTLGFLIYNFNPAKIFAGDSGSMFMGFMMSVIALLGFKNVTLTSFIVPILVFSIPILDTLFAIIRRLLKGEKITTRDESHIHHELLHKNLSIKQTVLIIYLVDMLFAIVSILYVLHNRYLGYILYGILLALVIVFVLNTNVIYDFKDKKKVNKKKKNSKR